MILYLLFYAVIYMGSSIYGTFMPIYFQSVGASNAQIGLLLSLGPLVAILAQPLWGAAGDRARTKNGVLAMLLIGSGGAILLFPLSDRFLFLLFVICLFSFFQTSIFAISDTITLDQLDKQKRWSFGPVRMGGTIGFAVMSLVFGMIAQAHIRAIFPAYAAVMLAGLLLLARFPKVAGYQSAGRRMHVWVLFRNPTLVLYLTISFVINVTLGYYYTFFPVYLHSIGGDSTLLGWSMAISSSSELPFLLYSGKILQRIRIPYILMASGAAAAVRWLLFYLIDRPYWLLPVQVLHGLIFIVLSVTIATYINREVPNELKASGQALNGWLSLGAGRIIGSFAGGIASNAIGMKHVFLYSSILALLSVAACGYAILRNSGRIRLGTENARGPGL